MGRGYAFQALTAIALAGLLVVMSGSATAGAATLLVLMILPGCKWLSLSRLPLHVAVPVALGGGLLLGLTAITLIEPILSLLGRDQTLSGRTRLWEFALTAAKRKECLRRVSFPPPRLLGEPALRPVIGPLKPRNSAIFGGRLFTSLDRRGAGKSL
jgi:hypothetical protein